MIENTKMQCGHCGVFTILDVRGYWCSGYGEIHIISSCINCRNPNNGRFFSGSCQCGIYEQNDCNIRELEFNSINSEISWTPKFIDKNAPDYVPIHIAGIIREMNSCFSHENNRMAISAARSILDALCKDKNISGKDLKDKLSNSDLEILPNTRKQAQKIRMFGNDATHDNPAYYNLDNEDVELIVKITLKIVEEVYDNRLVN